VELHPPASAWNSEIAPFTATDEHKQNEQNFTNHSNETQHEQHTPSPLSSGKKSHTEKLYFTIGSPAPRSFLLPSLSLSLWFSSVDSFERKMEEAQSKLHNSNHDYVEVVYQTEFQYLKMFLEYVLPLSAPLPSPHSLIECCQHLFSLA
jgi:hypothetical protein